MTLDPALLPWADKIIILVLIFLFFLLARGQRAVSFPQPVPVGPPAPVPVPIPVPIPVPQPPAPIPSPPAPVPDPPKPVPVPVPSPAPVPPAPPAPGIPRFTVTATDFAGPNDSISSSTSAYDEHIIRGATELAGALPYRFPGKPPAIRVFGNSRTVDVPIEDVGPYNTHDPYWDGSGHPLSESQYASQTKAQDGRVPSQPAGLDLTPAVFKALGFSGNLNSITTHLSWDFVTVLDKGNVAPSVPVPPVGPAQPPAVGGTVLQHNDWPPQSEALLFFGNPASAGWEKANLVTVQCPWQLISEGVQSTHNTITIHRKCADSLQRILNYIWEQADKSQAVIDDAGYNVFDGSYNYRPIAGTSTLSEHAYGGALDFNAAENPQYATVANSKFKANGVIVQAFKAEGWTWGGDWSPAYRDAMHFQALRT